MCRNWTFTCILKYGKGKRNLGTSSAVLEPICQEDWENKQVMHAGCMAVITQINTTETYLKVRITLQQNLLLFLQTQG